MNKLGLANVISVTNQKGGVAKTTTAIHLAAGLAGLGSNCLLLDIDSQRNATGTLLDRNNFTGDESIFTVFQGGKASGAIIHSTEVDKLSVIPSSLQLVEVESMLSSSIDGFFRLSEGIQKLKKEFDYIIIDCPPSLSVLSINALVAADYVLIPLQVSKFSIDGIQSINDAVNTVKKRYNAELKILGGVLTMYNPRTNLARAIVPEVEKHIPIMNAKIAKSVIVEEAHLLKKTLFQYAPQNKITLSYLQLCKEVEDAIR